MKKILSVILVLAICMTALVSCKKKDESIPDGMKIAENEYVTPFLIFYYNIFCWNFYILNGFKCPKTTPTKVYYLMKTK